MKKLRIDWMRDWNVKRKLIEKKRIGKKYEKIEDIFFFVFLL